MSSEDSALLQGFGWMVSWVVDFLFS